MGLSAGALSPSAGGLRFSLNPDGSICKATARQARRYRCPFKPSIPDPDCPQAVLGASTCTGQQQAGATCRWSKADSGDVVIGTEEYTCSVRVYEEKCTLIK